MAQGRQTKDALIAGVDEAGRGPLAGPVVAAAVILDPQMPIEGLKDSKKLPENSRVRLAAEIKARALAWAIGRAEVEEIDTINILQATFLAMQRAVQGLSVNPVTVWVDGPHTPIFGVPAKAIVRGDDLVPAISAASILAKVYRDEEMIRLDKMYPQYHFAAHKGYATEKHVLAIHQHGQCIIHRKSFRVPAVKAVS